MTPRYEIVRFGGRDIEDGDLQFLRHVGRYDVYWGEGGHGKRWGRDGFCVISPAGNLLGWLCENDVLGFWSKSTNLLNDTERSAFMAMYALRFGG